MDNTNNPNDPFGGSNTNLNPTGNTPSVNSDPGSPTSFNPAPNPFDNQISTPQPTPANPILPNDLNTNSQFNPPPIGSSFNPIDTSSPQPTGSPDFLNNPFLSQPSAITPTAVPSMPIDNTPTNPFSSSAFAPAIPPESTINQPAPTQPVADQTPTTPPINQPAPVPMTNDPFAVPAPTQPAVGQTPTTPPMNQPIPSQIPSTNPNPADIYTQTNMSPNPVPQPNQNNQGSNTDAAPTDLSHLISNSPADTTANYSPPMIQPETLIVPPNPNDNVVVPGAPAQNESHSMPKWVIGIGIALLIAVAGASGYFILGIGHSQSTVNNTSIPATTSQQSQLSPPAPVATTPPAPPAPPATTSGQLDQSGFGNLQGGTTQNTPSQATTAADLIRQRQQQLQSQ